MKKDTLQLVIILVVLAAVVVAIKKDTSRKILFIKITDGYQREAR